MLNSSEEMKTRIEEIRTSVGARGHSAVGAEMELNRIAADFIEEECLPLVESLETRLRESEAGREAVLRMLAHLDDFHEGNEMWALADTFTIADGYSQSPALRSMLEDAAKLKPITDTTEGA
jgi:hypothetical protein